MQKWSRGSNSHLNVCVFVQEMELIGYYRPAGLCMEHLQMFRRSIQPPVSLSTCCDEENRCTTGCSGKYQPALPASCLKSVPKPRPPSESWARTRTSAVTASISHVTEQTVSLKLSLQAPWSPGPQSQIISPIISHFVYMKTQNLTTWHSDPSRGCRWGGLEEERGCHRDHLYTSAFAKMFSTSKGFEFDPLGRCGHRFRFWTSEFQHSWWFLLEDSSLKYCSRFMRYVRAKKPLNSVGPPEQRWINTAVSVN